MKTPRALFRGAGWRIIGEGGVALFQLSHNTFSRDHRISDTHLKKNYFDRNGKNGLSKRSTIDLCDAGNGKVYPKNPIAIYP